MNAKADVQRYFRLFDTLVLHGPDDKGELELAGNQVPAWFADHAEAHGKVFDLDNLAEIYPFLESFWPDAQQAWAKQSSELTRSGIWEESQPELDAVYLEAIATVAAGQPLLFIGPLMFDYEAKARMLQTARELLLSHEKLEQREAELKKSRRQQRDILAAIPDTYFMIDKDNRIIEHNSKTLPTMPQGVDLGCAFAREAKDNLEVALAIVRDSGTHRELDVRQMIGDKSRDFELRLAYLDGDRVLCVVRDVTRAREIERMKDSFLSVASHELRSPLTAVAGALGYILSEFTNLPGDLEDWLSMAKDTNDRLLRLVDRLLHIEKIESGYHHFNKTKVDMGDFLKAAALSFSGLSAGMGTPIKVTDFGQDLHVWMDPDAMRQVLDNLVSNGIKHSPPGKTVEVSATLHEDMVRLAILDRGAGIPTRYRDQIFSKFFQVRGDKTAHKGTGLGLSIAKAIVEEHRGTIGLCDGQPTVFYVDLPRVPGQVEQVETAQ